MTKSLYPRLAADNIKKQAQIYLPYIIAAAATVMMYFLMSNLSHDEGLLKMSGGSSLKEILVLGSVVVAIIGVIVLFYVNSFIIKRRSKEFGLYNVLGMAKRHIALVASWEVLFTGVISIVSGLLLGVLLSKLMQLLISKLIGVNVSFGFQISLSSIVSTLLLFALIFAGTLIYNMVRVYLAKPTELLSAGNVGEREPKAGWVKTIFGILCLGGGYYIALTNDSPMDAIGLFFIAVLLVIEGTYLLFSSVSIALLKAMRRNKNYYYQSKHFVSVSSMIYRMKRNSTGLATICILATAVLIMVSTTLSLYLGVEDVLRTRYPQNVSITAYEASDNDIARINAIFDEVLVEYGAEPVDLQTYSYLTMVVSANNGVITEWVDDMSLLYLIPLEDYNRMDNQNVTLAANEILLYVSSETSANEQYDSLTIGGNEWNVTGAAEMPNTFENYSSNMGMTCYFIVFPDDASTLAAYNSISSEDDQKKHLNYTSGFDLDVDSETQIAIGYELEARFNASELNFYLETAETSRASFYTTYGGLFFLGIFLGIMFMLYTVLIIYYKQITEGYEDKERFVIMQKVGMSRDMVRNSIKNQVVSVFFLPLLVAAIHVAAAFRIITQLLMLFNLSNMTLFIICTICTLIAFAVFYGIVYLLTAREYYKIVKA